MKKITAVLITTLLLFTIISCGSRVKQEDFLIVKESNDKYELKDSFKMDDYNVFVYNLGTVKNVPINTQNSYLFHYEQEETNKYELRFTEIDDSDVYRDLETITNGLVNLDYSALGYDILTNEQEKVEAGINSLIYNNLSNSLKKTQKENIDLAISKLQQANLSKEFWFRPRKNKEGYYLYTNAMDLDLYGYAAYNKQTNKIETAGVYPYVETIKTKVLYTEKKNYGLGLNKIMFDLKEIDVSSTPTTNIQTTVNVTLNQTLYGDTVVQEYKIWDTYKNIPDYDNDIKYLIHEGWANEYGEVITKDNIINIYEDHTLEIIMNHLKYYERAYNGFHISVTNTKRDIVVNIKDFLDLDYFKEEGYDIRIRFNFSLAMANPIGIEANLNVGIYTGKKSLYARTVKANSTTPFLTNVTYFGSANSLENDIIVKLDTKNAIGLHIDALLIEVNFIK